MRWRSGLSKLSLDSNRKRAAAVAAGAAIAFAIVSGRSSVVPEASLVPVRQGSFEVKVATVGHVDTASAFHLTSQVRGDRGKVIQIVEDGAHVEKGDLLVTFDPHFFETEIQRLTGEVKRHESILEYEGDLLKLARSETEKQIANQKIEVSTVRQEYQRFEAYISELEALRKQGYAIESEIAQARRKSLGASTQLKKAEVDLDRIRKEAVFKIAQATAEVTKAQGELETVRASLELARAELAKTTVRAPTAGFVVLEEVAAPGDVKHKLRVGDTVWQGQPVLYVPDSSAMLVKTQVREADLHNLKEGLPADVEIDAYPGARLHGKVEQIGSLALEGSGSPDKNFQFTVRLEDQDARLRPGMTARVSIVVDRAKDVPVVPVAALFDEGGLHHAYVLDGRRLVERKVGVGRWNDDVAEVISGLKAGEKVSLVRP